jgi:hypothetical protein
MKQIFLGLLVMGMWGALMYFSYQLVEMFGRNARAERNLGGTRNGIVILGFVIMLVGWLILFGIIPAWSPMDSTPEWFGM